MQSLERSMSRRMVKIIINLHIQMSHRRWITRILSDCDNIRRDSNDIEVRVKLKLYIYIYSSFFSFFKNYIKKRIISFSIKHKYIVFQWQSDGIRGGENTFKIFKKQSKKKKQYPSKSKFWRIIEKISETIKSC